MKKTYGIVTLLPILLGLFLATASFAQGDTKGTKTAKDITVKGEIVDLACYLDHGATGMKHQQCALTCLKGGQPMGLLTSEGKVYLLLADHQDGKAFDEAKTQAALQVEVTGPLAEKAGITGLTVEKIKKL
jgi:type 1 fimbria pilin